MRGVHLGRHAPAELLVDGGANVADRRARRVHLSRTVRHVDADGAVHAVRIPIDDVAVLIALGDEAVVVGAVARPLATAEAGHVAQDLGMLGRELIRSRNDFVGTRRRFAESRCLIIGASSAGCSQPAN